MAKHFLNPYHVSYFAENLFAMIFKFRMISGDEKAFLREYEMPSNETFLSFHKFLQSDLEYDPSQLASFFITDEQWNKGLELTLIDMENDAGPAAIPMESVKLSDLLKNKKDRLLYVFDIFSDRCYFIELSDISQPQPDVKYPRCKTAVGTPPEQLVLGDISMDDILEDEDEFGEITNDISSIEDIDFESEGYSVEDF